MWVKFLLKETTTTNSIIWESNLDLLDHRLIPNHCMLLAHTNAVVKSKANYIYWYHRSLHLFVQYLVTIMCFFCKFFFVVVLSRRVFFMRLVTLINLCSLTMKRPYSIVLLPYAWKFLRYVNLVDFTVTYRYSENLICENLLVCNN